MAGRHGIFRILIILAGILCNGVTYAQEHMISNYKAFYASGRYEEQDFAIIRKFAIDGVDSYLTVDPQTLSVQVIPADDVAAVQMGWGGLTSEYKSTPYMKAAGAAKKQSFALQDAGIIHGFPKEQGITLTIDLCPSHKPLDRIILHR